jgi:Na+/H+ antiporter NhaD/arsenite permease-like protein
VIRRIRRWFVPILLVGLGLTLTLTRAGVQAESSSPSPLVTSQVSDPQGQPVAGAQVTAEARPGAEPIAQTTTQPDGRYALSLPDTIPGTLVIQIERAHFAGTSISLDAGTIQSLRDGRALVLPSVTLQWQVGLAFWLATLIFVAVLVIIAAGTLHNALAALLGATLVLIVSYASRLGLDALFIFDFQRALSYVDWNVVFLIMGMMIVIAVVERTGLFQWLALMAYRLSGGRIWVLVAVLMLITGIGSAFLDNVTTMLLMTPITIQIALVLGISPLALLLPEVMASNLAGVSTLIGTPTNILIGSYADLPFTGFLANLTPGVLLAFIGLVIYSELVYRDELSRTEEPSPHLGEELVRRARITQPDHLKKAGLVGAGMLVLFLLGDHVHLLPAVTALTGATALLIWIRPDVEEMIEAVDWTTLVFFITLFILVGAIREVGLISLIANGIGQLVGSNLLLTMLAVIWFGALLSTVVANIPLTAAMLPVVGYLSGIVPGAENRVLFYCLSVGSGMGGNGSLIGASANMVTAGIAERAGYPVSYLQFLKKGFPALVLTVGLAALWLILRFLVLASTGS